MILCANDIYCKYTWVFLLEDKKGITVTNALQTILDKSYGKPKKL